MITAGSICTGYAGLDGAIEAVFGAETAWVADIDPGAVMILEHRLPDLPNIGDITLTDWGALPAVDLIGGGIPCQPFSHAGRRKGTADARHLWPSMAAAIAIHRPALVVIENVQGLVNRGLVVVLADLARMGYDAVWVVVSARDAGAPHQRKRLWVLGVRDGVPAPDSIPVAVLDDGGWVNPGDGLFGAVPFTGRVPDHGVMSGGQVFARSAPSTRGSGLALPTPAAHDSGNSPETHLAKKPGRSRVTSLQVIAEHGLLETGGELLGTPRASDGMAYETVESTRARMAGATRRSRGTLEESIASLRTPTAQLAINGGSQTEEKRKAGGHGPTLADQIEHMHVPALPTPARHDSKGGVMPASDTELHRSRGAGGHSDLASAAMWLGQAPSLPTPNQTDYKGSNTPEGRLRDGKPRAASDGDLSAAVEALPHSPRAPRGGSGTELMYDLGGERDDSGRPQGEVLLPTPRGSDGEKGGPNQRGSSGDLMLPSAAVHANDELLPTPKPPRDGDPAGDGDGDLEAVVISVDFRARTAGVRARRADWLRPTHGQVILPGTLVAPDAPDLSVLGETACAWGKYAPGIARWERILGRPAPAPTMPGRDGKPRLSPWGVEFMMGLPYGWVCDVPGLTRTAMLKALGNGVVPLQAVLALRLLLAEAFPAGLPVLLTAPERRTRRSSVA